MSEFDYQNFTDQRLPVNIEDEMRKSYLDYAMSVIIGRALPDVRDGLKPVHRRILYGMYEQGNRAGREYKKSARIVGDVMGKYHPHGDSAIYDAVVRMAQDFSMRYELVDGQGNFGSLDGDNPAAMRYTEVRLTRLAEELLGDDIEKETVDWIPNYDGTEREPSVLPAKFPNLLVNGSSGIAVGMATNIPPHNLGEVIDACLMVIEKPTATVGELMQVLPGPDFPTAGFIHGLDGIYQAYKTGRGIVQMRARAVVETSKKGDKQQIVVTEIPYMTNKARLLERVAELVREKKIDGIADLRDESDREGIRVVIELKRNEVPEVVLNNLYSQTQMQTTFGIIFLAIVNNKPEVMDLPTMLKHFVEHRKEIVVRRTRFVFVKAGNADAGLTGEFAFGDSKGDPAMPVGCRRKPVLSWLFHYRGSPFSNNCRKAPTSSGACRLSSTTCICDSFCSRRSARAVSVTMTHRRSAAPIARFMRPESSSRFSNSTALCGWMVR